MLRELSTGECEALLSRARVGRIAVRDAEGAYIVPMSFVYDGGVIHAHHLPPTLQTAEVSNTLPGQALADAVSGFEKDLILDGLKIARGNRAKAARLLRTTERILNYKIGKLGIDASRFRP